MKDIVKEYGFMAIAVVVTLGVFATLFVVGTNSGIFSQVAEETQESDVEVISVAQEAVAVLASSQRPTVTASIGLSAGKAYNQGQLFVVTDSDGNAGSFRIISIASATGEDMTEEIYNADLGLYTFPYAGVYSVKLYCSDASGVTDSGWSYLCVSPSENY